MMLLDCTCGATNRIPSLPKTRMRCGKCAHVFTPSELCRARIEPPPERPEALDPLAEMMAIFGAAGLADFLGDDK